MNKNFEEEVLQYPSVTVCAEYTFKKYIDKNMESGDIGDIEKLVKANVWKKNETFYFLNQKGSLKKVLTGLTLSPTRLHFLSSEV